MTSKILHALSLEFSGVRRAASLFIHGYIFRSDFGRFEFRRSFLRPWLNSLGIVGAWMLRALGVIVAAFSLWFMLWFMLWLGYDAGLPM